MPEPRPLRVFLCHAKEDKPAIRNLYSLLKSQPWIEPWLDEVNLLPGMDWEVEIFKALRDADAILVCLSKESIAKEGYIQKEFKRALGFAEEKPEGAIYLIPLRLDDCKPPLKFQQWQWADFFLPEAQKKLLQSLYLRAGALNILPPPAKPTPTAKPAISASTVDYPSRSKPDPDPTLVGTTPGGHFVYKFGGLEFVKVPAGDFYMGADDIDANSGACKPQHLVYQLKYDFYMARFPVTNQQYSLMARETGAPIVMAKGKILHPVVNVSWYDAQKYIEWLNRKYKAELPDGYRFCLPSEAEWEKAARGAEGNEYPWGDKFDKNKCNTDEGKKGGTTSVGAYSPQGDSPFGCADMAGNVWEWTRSLWGKDGSLPTFKYPYRFDDKREDENADKSVIRVLRGGSFYGGGLLARCAFRNWLLPDYLNILYGFRVAASPVLS
jgi:formylglycine-generating enzyme required for sulfatase activity